MLTISFKTEKLFLLSVFALLAGRAYQHLFLDAPYWALFWDQELMEGVITSIFNISWYEYVTSLTYTTAIQGIIKSFGVFYLITALSSILIFRQNDLLRKVVFTLLITSSVFLLLLAFLYFKDTMMQPAMFFEQSAQFLTPFLFVFFIKNGFSFRFKLLMKIAIALTFISHGLYAIGLWHPLPGNFLQMTIASLGITNTYAEKILLIIGVLDILASIGIFFPRFSKIALWYCVIWGFITALSRLTNNVFAYRFWELIHQWLFEFLVRVPHFLLPLVLILPTLSKSSKINGSEHVY